MSTRWQPEQPLTERQRKLIERARDNGGWSASQTASMAKASEAQVRAIFAEGR